MRHFLDNIQNLKFDEFWNLTSSFLRIIIAVWGFLLVTRQLNNQNKQIAIQNEQLEKQKNIARSELIFKITESIDDAKYNKIFQLLSERRKASNEREDNNTSAPKITQEDMNVIRGLLRYFSKIVIILDRKVLSVQDIFSLMAYRVFLVVGDKDVQVEYLCNEDKSIPQFRFVPVYGLYEDLMDYLDEKFTTPEEKIKVLVEYNVIIKNGKMFHELPCYTIGVENYYNHHRVVNKNRGYEFYAARIIRIPFWTVAKCVYIFIRSLNALIIKLANKFPNHVLKFWDKTYSLQKLRSQYMTQCLLKIVNMFKQFLTKNMD